MAGKCVRLAMDPPPRWSSTADIFDSWTYQGSSNDNQHFFEVASRCQRPQQSYSLRGSGTLELFDSSCRQHCRLNGRQNDVVAQQF